MVWVFPSLSGKIKRGFLIRVQWNVILDQRSGKDTLVEKFGFSDTIYGIFKKKLMPIIYIIPLEAEISWINLNSFNKLQNFTVGSPTFFLDLPGAILIIILAIFDKFQKKTSQIILYPIERRKKIISFNNTILLHITYGK